MSKLVIHNQHNKNMDQINHYFDNAVNFQIQLAIHNHNDLPNVNDVIVPMLYYILYYVAQ